MKHNTIDPIALRDALPSEMLRAGRWLLWKEIHDHDDPKPRKVPFYADGTPRRGALDSPEDVAHLVSFDDACAAFAPERYAGLGFALGDGWQGIDLDGCRDPENDAVTTTALGIVTECSSYTEASPSGRGIHIIGHGTPFEPIGAASNDKGIEAYSGGRYFTVTGSALRNPGELADTAPVVERLRQRLGINGVERGTAEADTEVGAIGEGRRNPALTSMAGKLRRIGLRESEIVSALQQMNRERCRPPLTPKEVASIAHSIGRYEPGAESKPAELDYVFADDLKDDVVYGDDLVESLIERRRVSVVYGDTNSGKTFFVVDLGAGIARPVQWMGRQVEGGLVIYLAAEAPESIQKRVTAYKKHHRCKVPNFVIVRSPIDLFNGEADTGLVIDLIHKIERETGKKAELVIGDTLARLSAGANENSSDMSVVIGHVDRIRAECAVHFMLIHHCGKDAARGMRGWSGVRAAIDTEIEITDTEGVRAAEITKQRDIGGKGERIGFRLEVVPLGIGKWGKPITSCVVTSADAPPKATGKRPSAIEGAIIEFLATRGTGIKKRDLAAHFEGRYPDTSVYREVRKLVAEKKLYEAVGVVTLASYATA